MGGYKLYFIVGDMIHLAHLYAVKLSGYNYWGGYIMTPFIFKNVRSFFHPESWMYLCGYKCHQVHYFVHLFNYKEKWYFSWVTWCFWWGVNSNKYPLLSCKDIQQILNRKNIVDFSSWPMPNIISSSISTCTKVKIQQHWHPPITKQPTHHIEIFSQCYNKWWNFKWFSWIYAYIYIYTVYMILYNYFYLWIATII